MGQTQYRNREWSQNNTKWKRGVCVLRVWEREKCVTVRIGVCLDVKPSAICRFKTSILCILTQTALAQLLHVQTNCRMTFFFRLLSSITEPTQLQGEGGEPPVYEPSQPSPLAPCEDGCDQDKVEQGGIKKVCFKVNEEDQEDSGHDTMSYRDSYR